MDPVSIFLLIIAAIFIIGIAGELVFEKTGVPDVVWLIVVGIVLGPISGTVTREQLMAVAPYFGALTLVIVLFDGGSELRLDELRAAARRGGALAIAGFLASILVLAPASMLASAMGILPESWTWLHGVMLGAILGGSSSVVIMPALAKAGLVPRIANVLNLDSALTDVLCVVVAAACIDIAVTGSTDAGMAAVALAKSFGIGLGVGCVVGLLSLLVLGRLKRSAYAYPLMLGGLLSLYVLVLELGGSAALAILAVAVMVGNAPALSKVVGLARTASLGRGVQSVHDEITFIIKSFFFTFIGAMLGPPWGLVVLGVLLGLLLLAARVPAAWLVSIGSGLSTPARGILAVSMPRGMAAGVLAMMPAQAGVAGTEQLSVVVFATVFTSILIFAAGFPILKRKLAILDPGSLVAPVPAGPADASMTADRSVGYFPPGTPADQTALDPQPAPAVLPAPSAESTTADQAIPLIRKQD
jgi:cell volume regulation protein A